MVNLPEAPLNTLKFDRIDPSVFKRIARTGMREDMTTRAAYSSDASIFRRIPKAVLEPKSVEDIRDGIAVAKARGWSIISRGGGTSVAGNAIGTGLIIDTSRYFNRILDIDGDNRTATVEPGVVCDALRDAVAEHGLTYGPDPSTHSRCTIGGMVANNACGSHSVAYGTAAENLVSVTIMLANGEEVTFGSNGVSDEGIDKQLHQLVDAHANLIDAELGRFPRQVSGYGLHYLLDKHGFDAAKAIAGTEGTVGVITKMTVKLVEVPKVKALAVLAFETVYDAASAAARLRLPGVATIEGMGGDLLDALRSKRGQEKAGGNLPGNRKGIPAGGWIYCEVGGDTLDEAEALAETVAVSVHTVDSVVVSEPKEMRELWRIREASAGVVTRLPDGGEAWPNWEDSAVPPENLADYLRDLYALMDKYSLRGIPFGHFGEGCVHVRISFDFGSAEGIEIFNKFMNEAAELVSSYDGSLSGEHGDGRARSALLDRMYSEEMRALFKQFKNILDPDCLFNPGVLVDPDEVTEGLRMAPGQRTFELTPVHKFSHDRGSMVNAVNRCVGVSACRSEENSMCPSFQITGDEVHSTRGRARLLSEMFRGESVADGYKSEEVLEALDLCLSCKACASECPVNVDMATYKSEFLHKHYKGKIRPMAHYMMGWLPLLGHIAHKVPLLPRIIDMSMRTPVLRTVIAKVGGLDTSRPLIRFAPSSLRKWHKKRSNNQATKTVVLWPDSFNASLDTSPATAAVEVLETLGYRVEIPQEFVCCGLTWHSTGQLDMTQRVLKQTAKVMKPYTDRGLTVIGIEPSCTVMLKGEATELSDDPAIHQLAKSTVSFAEFVAPLIKEKVDSGEIQPANISALTQVHCHEKSLGDPQHSAKLLDALGVSQSDIETGCCGLAGNWGFEKGHAEMSMALGERELFPKVRDAGAQGNAVIADGFSCRTHIDQGTGFAPQHVAEIVRDVMFKR
ncbi:MAG: FAD-binding oxidoreductase [Corynebacterium casei]|uniref:FAD-binding and (Fe-S)-binding domain-containing protein n=8 Tax=Corynebacterium casei TaxID=160386 RepID=UPI002647737C|nr:FAD-binding and (Fe-S)-binding domain-containing protein [Corynebacterium casei]MDN6312643.1 FAD-binding oxidoreductase [Corynebacterium casei]MDN6381926.1 FAD-binding oxidoreductase [Corynebacterium casei]MDN6493132.1 FAD-binding oxidoreductase [Corynebacterium casei]